jgi:hypothetical protein
VIRAGLRATRSGGSIQAASLTLGLGLALHAGVANAQPAPLQVSSSSDAARPDGKRIVGILELKVEGVPPEIAAQFESNLAEQVDLKHFWVAPQQRLHALMANSTHWTEGCLVGKCLREVKVQTGADLVLLAALTGSGTSFGYVVTLVRTDTGNVLDQKTDRCDVCTVNEALAAATAATVKLLNDVPDRLPDPAGAAAVRVATATHTGDAAVAHHHSHTRAVGATLAIVGLVVGGVGAAMYATNHSTPGTAMLAAGGGVAASGVLVLTF